MKNTSEANKTEASLARLNECFLNFSIDPVENIKRLTALCGEVLGADCALYNRLDKGMLCSWAQWNAPADYRKISNPEGHICYDVINSGKDEAVVVQNLPRTKYANTDPNVGEFNLKTYMGIAVKLADKYVGSLCVVYQNDFIPSEDDKRIMGLIASAIGVEESRKQAQEYLKESEERYRTLAESAQDFIFVIDSDWRIKYVNVFGAESIGYKPEEIIDKLLIDVFPRNITEFFQKNLVKVFESGRPLSGEDKIEFPDRKLWLDAKLIPLKEADGRVSAVMGIARDITERKDSEEELRLSEARYRTIIEVQTELITRWLPGGMLTFVNDACCSYFGKKREELIGKSFMPMIPEEDRERVKNNLARLSRENPIGTHEHRVILPTGEIRWQRWTNRAIFDEQGNLIECQSAGHDITERKLVQQALQDRERFLSSIFSSIQDGISILDTELNVLQVNPTMEKWYAHNMPLVGKKCYQAYHCADVPCAVCPSQRTLATGNTAYDVVPKRIAGGQQVGWFDLYSFPLIDSATGKIKGVIEYVRDISERRKAEEEILSLSKFPLENPNPVIRVTKEAKVLYANPAAKEQLFNYCKCQVGGYMPAHWKEWIKAAFESADKETQEIEAEYGGRLFSFIIAPFPDMDYANLYGRDITERKKAEELIKREKEKAQTYLDIAGIIFIVLDVDGNVSMVNKKGKEILGLDEKEIIGKNWFDNFLPEKYRQAVKNDFKKIINGEIASLEYHENPILNNIGQERVIAWHNIILRDDKNKIIGTLSSGEDITERKKIEEEKATLNKELLKSHGRLKQLALRDPHTGLYNHRYLQEIIEAEFDRSRRYAQPLSVMMLDIDYFKSINDVYGHKFGDLVLKQFATILKKMVRRYDTVIRYGGEEFIIICSGTDRANALVLAKRILDAINLFDFGNKKHSVKLKISIAVASYNEDRALKGMDLVELTDQILNRAKESGGNRVYSSLDTEKAKHPPKISIKNGDIKFLNDKIEKLSRRANQSLMEAIFAFAKTIEVKDHYTGEHVERTVRYATEIAKALNLAEHDIELIRQASMLHDLGKIGISEKILLKKGRLTKSEFAQIKKHPQIGVDIIRPIQFLHPIIPILLYHHERWDGKGYPNSLKGEDIPVGARIVAIADVYQALISDRCYRRAYTQDKAIEIIREESGKLFDPQIVDAFLKIVHKVE
jgi:diguanylate cyclase (GGDEF)-like protein/PAS domain S-box-containing protein